MVLQNMLLVGRWLLHLFSCWQCEKLCAPGKDKSQVAGHVGFSLDGLQLRRIQRSQPYWPYCHLIGSAALQLLKPASRNSEQGLLWILPCILRRHQLPKEPLGPGDDDEAPATADQKLSHRLIFGNDLGKGAQRMMLRGTCLSRALAARCSLGTEIMPLNAERYLCLSMHIHIYMYILKYMWVFYLSKAISMCISI